MCCCCCVRFGDDGGLLAIDDRGAADDNPVDRERPSRSRADASFVLLKLLLKPPTGWWCGINEPASENPLVALEEESDLW